MNYVHTTKTILLKNYLYNSFVMYSRASVKIAAEIKQKKMYTSILLIRKRAMFAR